MRLGKGESATSLPHRKYPAGDASGLDGANSTDTPAAGVDRR
jgi:hypothetical protein